MTAENCSRPFFCEHQHSSVEETIPPQRNAGVHRKRVCYNFLRSWRNNGAARPHTKGEVGRAAGEGERQAGWGAGARQGQESCQGLLHKVKVQLPRLPLPPRPLRPHAARTSSRARSPGWLRPRAVRPREGAARCCALRARARARLAGQRAFARPRAVPPRMPRRAAATRRAAARAAQEKARCCP